MKILKETPESISKAVEVLRKEGLVIYPTETLYGIGADATNLKAIGKLSKYKQRPYGKPYSVAVVDQKMAEEYVFLNKTAESLYKTFLPGPVTIVSKGKHKVAKGVESETGTLGIRIPDYPFVLEMVKKLGRPITATSANASYQKRPYQISDILEVISEKQKDLIDLIIDAGKSPQREPSTVIDTTLDDLAILRQGQVMIKDKAKILSRSEENTQSLAKELLQKYEKFVGKRAIIFALEGPMGVGKTQFTKGIGRALRINEEIVSPTYTLEEEYEKKLIHIDAWRMETANELKDLGFARRISDKTIICIEWAEKVIYEIKKHKEDAIIIWVKLKYAKNNNERLISWGVL